MLNNTSVNLTDEIEAQEFTQEINQSELEWLREAVIALQQEEQRSAKKQQMIEQALRDLESEVAQITGTVTQQTLCLETAKQAAKHLLAEEKPMRETLAQLLSMIYGEMILPQDLSARNRQD